MSHYFKLWSPWNIIGGQWRSYIPYLRNTDINKGDFSQKVHHLMNSFFQYLLFGKFNPYNYWLISQNLTYISICICLELHLKGSFVNSGNSAHILHFLQFFLIINLYYHWKIAHWMYLSWGICLNGDNAVGNTPGHGNFGFLMENVWLSFLVEIQNYETCVTKTFIWNWWLKKNNECCWIYSRKLLNK